VSFVDDLHRDAASPPPDDCGAAGSQPVATAPPSSEKQPRIRGSGRALAETASAAQPLLGRDICSWETAPPCSSKASNLIAKLSSSCSTNPRRSIPRPDLRHLRAEEIRREGNQDIGCILIDQSLPIVADAMSSLPMPSGWPHFDARPTWTSSRSCPRWTDARGHWRLGLTADGSIGDRACGAGRRAARPTGDPAGLAAGWGGPRARRPGRGSRARRRARCGGAWTRGAEPVSQGPGTPPRPRPGLPRWWARSSSSGLTLVLARRSVWRDWTVKVRTVFISPSFS
jgi:hypothetical protein